MFTYILSGCDTVSYPFRRGKKRAAEIALRMIHNFSNISTFGNLNCSCEVTPEIVDEARENRIESAKKMSENSKKMEVDEEGKHEVLDRTIEYVKWMTSRKLVEDEKQELMVSRECVKKTK